MVARRGGRGMTAEGDGKMFWDLTEEVAVQYLECNKRP